MSVDLELYRIFTAVAEAGSFSEAANRLFLTQPAVSQAIQRLEQQLDVRLFSRWHRGVTLTQEGQLLYQHAASALQVLYSGEQKLQRMQNLKEGLLRLGAADTITREFLLPYISAFRQSYPGIQLQVTNRTSLQLVQSILQGTLDLAIVNLPIVDDRLCIQPILEIHDIFIAGHQFDFLHDHPLTPAELAEYPLIMLEQKSNSRCYVDRFFAQYQIVLSPKIELGSHDLLACFVDIGFGLACVVKEFCQKELDSKIVFPISLSPSIPSRHIGACWLKSLPLSVAAKEFLRLLSQEKSLEAPH